MSETETADPPVKKGNWHEVFCVKGDHNTLEDVGEAFHAKLKRLSEDKRIRAVDAEVQTDGTYQHILLGNQAKIVGYVIRVQFETEYDPGVAV